MSIIRRIIRHFNFKTKWHKQKEEEMKDSFNDLQIGDMVIYIGPPVKQFTYGQLYIIRARGQHNIVLINDDNHSHYISKEFACTCFYKCEGKYYKI